MKSAFELAMERLGGELQTYTDQQKAELAEVDGLYDSKVAQAKMDADSRLQTAAGEPKKRNRYATTWSLSLPRSPNGVKGRRKSFATASRRTDEQLALSK